MKFLVNEESLDLDCRMESGTLKLSAFGWWVIAAASCKSICCESREKFEVSSIEFDSRGSTWSAGIFEGKSSEVMRIALH